MKMRILMPTFSAGDFDPKVGQTDLILACNQGSLVTLCVQDYKSVCAAVAICSTLVNIQTDTHLHRQTALDQGPNSQKS